MATYTTNMPPHVYPQPVHQFIQVPAPEVRSIRDWLPWSIITIFVAWGLIGFVPLIFSLICRSRKRDNDIHGARTMSTLALVFNIILTLLGIAAWVGFIVWIVLYYRAVKNIYSS